MPGLPSNLRNRFELYLNILPWVEELGKWFLAVAGVVSLLVAVSRVSMKLSVNVQPSHRISKHRKYSIVYPETIQRNLGGDKVFELNEKSSENVMVVDEFYEINLDAEDKYMLDDEAALSGDESSDSDTKSSSFTDEQDGDSGSTKVSSSFYHVSASVFSSLPYLAVQS